MSTATNGHCASRVPLPASTLAIGLDRKRRRTSIQDTLIDLESVSKHYTLGEVQVHALQDLSLSIERGEFVVLVGPSGSGKTTTLNLIGGLDSPTEGRVHVNGHRLHDAGPGELTTYRAETVGFVFQFFNLIPTLTAVENVQFALEARSQQAGSTMPRASELLGAVELSDRLHHFPAQLSGGEQQRVAIARALANEPPILLCDEPTGNIDLETARTVLDTLQRLNQERQVTVVLVTHNRALTPIADRVLFLRDGRVTGQEMNESPASSQSLAW